MKLQKMTNAVADTEGEIFTTKSGSLRYVTDRKNPPTWIEGKKKLTLTVVPIEGTDETGAPVSYTFTELPARVVQHELDHLDGVLILDRTTPEARREALATLRPQPILGVR